MSPTTRPRRAAQFRFYCVLRIIKFASPIAAIFCFGALGRLADAAPSKKSLIFESEIREVARAKKSSASKKSEEPQLGEGR